MGKILTVLKTIFIDKMWDNIEFWHLFFLTVLISLTIIKILYIIDRNFGAFKKNKQYDLLIYRKISAFASNEEILLFLDDLLKNLRFKKSELKQIEDLISLLRNNNNRYKSELLRMHVDKISKDLNVLKHFLIINFSEEELDSISEDSYLVLLPETLRTLNDKNKKEILVQDNMGAEIIAQKQEFYFQKERELKEITQKVKNEYNSYVALIKRYLNV
ncbi:MAG: hypothetical protein OIF36_01305 [Alphaproteobacteria bacterium]|nr:hypothetical protein [Alphaproteobacteria bacterium]